MIAAKQADIQTGTDATPKSVPRRMLNEKQVLDIIPVSRTTLYRMEKAGRFPKSTYISPNRRVWFEDEIISWQNAVDEFDPSRGRGKGRRRARAVTALDALKSGTSAFPKGASRYPFGSQVTVTNPDYGKSVTVVINDRGPFMRGVTLDLTHGAARAIGMRATQWVCML